MKYAVRTRSTHCAVPMKNGTGKRTIIVSCYHNTTTLFYLVLKDWRGDGQLAAVVSRVFNSKSIEFGLFKGKSGHYTRALKAGSDAGAGSTTTRGPLAKRQKVGKSDEQQPDSEPGK